MKLDLPFTPPFRVVSIFKCGTDAHIVDAAGNVIVETSTWNAGSTDRHKEAMELIAETLNEKFAGQDP